MRRLPSVFIIQGPLRVMRWLPLSWLHFLGAGLGWIMVRRSSKKNAIIKRNLSIAFPNKTTTELAALHSQTTRSVGCFLFETGLVWHGSQEQIRRCILSIKGWDSLEHAKASRHGILLVGAHLGNWEILNLYLMMELKVSGLYRAPSDPSLDYAVRKARERFGGHLIPSGSQGMRHLLRTLKEGGVAGIIADQQPKFGEGVMAPFYGESAMTMTLIHRLVERTQARVFMASCYRVPYKGFKIQIDPMPEELGDLEQERAACVLNTSIEHAIDRHPEQYLWRYRRFPDHLYE